MNGSINKTNPLLSLTAKPVRPGHYPACSPTNPFFIRGYSDHPVAFCKAGFHNSNNQDAAAPSAPATPESEPRLPEASSNQNSPAKHPDSQNNDSHDNDAQDNMWVNSVACVRI